MVSLDYLIPKMIYELFTKSFIILEIYRWYTGAVSCFLHCPNLFPGLRFLNVFQDAVRNNLAPST